MAIIKSYTDLEQSKTLAKILPLESADMLFHFGEYKYADSIRVPLTKEHWERMMPEVNPCWSLAALLNVIPQEIFDGEYIINITEGCDDRWVLTYDHYENRNHSYFGLATGADNLIDACYEMILKLHELKML